ncbi:hypothetical protein PLICRDRAFT_178412 [Plicaturopsis crispa FD-325 SS-3]|nr:hypothetical protein PLICRDRAFT_178412 [Plicaturopsis crispa FD-325 SS-3]
MGPPSRVHTRDVDNGTRRRLASRPRLVTVPAPAASLSPRWSAKPPGLPPSAHDHRTTVALRARSREAATTRRDASWRLVIVTPLTAAASLHPQYSTMGRRLARAFLHHWPTVSRAASPCARDDDTTRRQTASRRRCFAPAAAASRPPPPPAPTTGPASRVRCERVHARRRRQDETPLGVLSSLLAHQPPRPPPSSVHNHGPSVSRALRARARETATTRRDAKRRLVVVTLPAAPPSSTPSTHQRPGVSCALRARARETTTTTRDASRRLVVVAFPLPPPPPSSTISGPAVSRALQALHAGQQRRDETPAGVSSSSLHPPPPLPPFFPQHTIAGPPSRARETTTTRRQEASRRRYFPSCPRPPLPSASAPTTVPAFRVRCERAHARRRQRNETPAGVSSSSLSQPPRPPPSSVHNHGPSVSRALRARARETATTRRDAKRRLVVVTPSAATVFLHPQHPPRARRLACAASPCTQDKTVTTKRDAGWRLVVVIPPTAAALLATLSTPRTTSTKQDISLVLVTPPSATFLPAALST